MKIVCDNCSTKYSIADEKVRGKVFKIKCKKCSHIIVVKGQESTAEGQPAGFDQKETRVFDYSGFDGQKNDPGGAGADPIWHMVIDREQIGPLTVAEVQQKWSTGECDRDTYAWREGFADWQRLGAIEELADVLRTPGGESGERGAEDEATTAGDTPGGAGLFGDGGATPAHGSPSVGRADPTDLFAGAGTSTEDEMPADLFGSARSSQPAVFSSSVAPVGARRTSREEQSMFSAAGEASVDTERADIRPMTAQRNENSVLFSLNNLSALAGSEPAAPSPSSPRQPASGLSSFGAPGGPEGSGLIDIRAMAAMTLGATRKDEEEHRTRTRRPSEDDLPVFSASSFSAPAAGVLLPTVQQPNNRTFYIAIGAVGLLAVTAIVLVAWILLGKANTPVSAAIVPGDPLVAPAQTPPSVPPETGQPAAPSGTSPPSSGTPPSSATPPPSTPPAAATPAATPAREERDKPRAEPSRPTPARPTRTEPSRPAPEPTRTAEPTPPPRSDPPPREPSKPAQKCDEVACLVTPDLPCCPKRGGSSTRPAASSSDSNLPDKLEQSDIIAGMKAVNGRVNACNDRFRVSGAFKVKVTVGADGSVDKAAAGAPIAGTPAAACVENAVRSARFKKTKNPITFNYPYTFR